MKDFVVDVANSRTNAKLLVEMLPRVLDVTAEVALARVVAASAGLVQPGATPAEEALGKVHERLCATRKKLRHNMAVGALAFTFEHPRVDMAVDLSVDDVMGALAALTCLPVESLAVHLSTADAARATTCELRSQLEAAYRVVWHLPARQRLLELEALETAALSKPPQALEVRYHELHAPLREARRAVYDGMEDAVAAQDVLMRYPGARGFMAAFASRAPTVVGARKLQQLVEVSDTADVMSIGKWRRLKCSCRRQRQLRGSGGLWRWLTRIAAAVVASQHGRQPLPHLIAERRTFNQTACPVQSCC